MDQKHFVLNDIVPITVSNPTNAEAFTVIVSSDVNGYTWLLQDQAGSVLDTGTGLYGDLTG
jgi:hypothetical protein